MSNQMKCFILALAVAVLSLGTPVAFAKYHHGGGHAKEYGGKEHAAKKHEGTPPGWKHGKKKGWEGKDKPPGLAKKEEQKPD